MSPLYKQKPGIAARQVAGTTLLVHHDNSDKALYTLNSTGLTLWELLAQPQNNEQLAQHLVARHPEIPPEKALADTTAFIECMAALKLIQLTIT